MKFFVVIANILMLLALVNSSCFSQTFVDENTTQENTSNFLLNASTSNINTTSNISDPNAIFIDQIGSFNEASLNVNAAVSDIQLFQTGSNNFIGLEIFANELSQLVIQDGNQHRFLNFSSNSNIQNLEIIQSGNSQNMVFFGGNSISENMKVTMQGDNQSLIIRNFN